MNNNMSLPQMIQSHARIRLFFTVMTALALVCAAFFMTKDRVLYGGYIKAFVIVAVIAGVMTVICSIGLNKEINVQRRIMCLVNNLYTYLLSEGTEGEAKMYMGLVMTIIDYYLPQTFIHQLQDMAVNSVKANESPAASGKEILEKLLDRFLDADIDWSSFEKEDDEPGSIASGMNLLSGEERELCEALCRKMGKIEYL